MKKILLILFSILLFTTQTNAQKGKSDQLKTLKISYISEVLELTSDEAQNFWPIYNKHQDKIHKLRRIKQKELIEKIKSSGGIDALSEKEAEKILDEFMAIENNIQVEQSKMYSELRQVISVKKVLKLHRAENEFNRKLIQRLRREKADVRQKQ